ncbi:TIGR01777 family oxidoreductase [Croceitalea rosinachiae]|uniref:TIGR01777 family oxidoreductase n=1 Tax=Croceitalea rosinachiae TaxID=3075596 RepID=A0ABU3ADD7_9FLAO|nr:TIGR01777 family oxidoreductase [Croceitalea sp. F388]MDT0608199.1 TIGR01777 family oxidoreductase [Croceitalea sp. F388]
MKVLITGATGLVGNAIVKKLHAKGIQVNYLTTRKNKIVIKEDYQGYHWSPEKFEIDNNCFVDVSTIINLAGATISKRWTESHKNEVLNSRVNSLKTLKKGLKQRNFSQIESFVSASAVGIYPTSLSTLYTEDEDQIDDSFLGNVVKVWEDEIDSFNDFGFKVSKIRIGLVLSKEGGALPKMAKPIKNYVGSAFGAGEQWQSWIHIEDLARMFLFVSLNQLSGTFNGVAPNPVTNSKMTIELAKTLRRPLILPNVPEFVMKFLLGEMAYLLFASQRVSSKRIEKKGFQFHHLNICKALEAIYHKNSDTQTRVSDYSKEFA